MSKTLLTIVFLSLSIAAFSQTFEEYQRKASDTNYWHKNISPPNSGVYTELLLPARDTVQCYFQFPKSNTQKGYNIEVVWCLGWVTRFHEQITGFYLNKTFNRVYNTILSYKIFNP